MLVSGSWDDDEYEPGFSQEDVSRKVGRDVIPTMEAQNWTTVYHSHPSQSSIFDESTGRDYEGPSYHFEKLGPAGTKSYMGFDFHPVNGNPDDQEPGWHVVTQVDPGKAQLPAGRQTPYRMESFVSPRDADRYHQSHVMDIAQEMRSQLKDAHDFGFYHMPTEESSADSAYTNRDLGVGEVSKDPKRLFPEGIHHDLFQRLNSTKRTPAKKKPKERKPEEVWYDVHKHPEGVPGGMGKAPEHYLRARGWSGHEINEGSGKKTIQYMNQDFPDFVLSYGGGSSTKPDHNFRVLYIGTNTNIPKVTRAYSVAEAMNKVEELQQLEDGLVVQPMTHGAASLATQPSVSRGLTFVAPVPNKTRPDMNKDDLHPIGFSPESGYTDERYPTRPDEQEDWVEPKVQVKEIKPPKPKKKLPTTTVETTTTKKEAIYHLAQQESWEA